MQLKKIILKGFKSFPDKTVLEFDDGVTAIVGPNGSGKSNVIEAIRWVMGEQSAKTLRGNRMDDIIFSGTRERKAINIAEVELILDNSNDYLDIGYEEVSILRRLSKSSGSTYMINKQECRLKDVVDLFMDSGLGKESFSVISQGEVEAIFNSKPKERRGIFEEAAGVFKYKVRKENAEKKLEETEDNLDRVRDILYELESQLEPLKEQSDIARSYLDHREKLTDLDIALSVRQIEELSVEIKEDQEKEKQLLEKLDQIEVQINDSEIVKNKTQTVLNNLRDQAEELNKNILQVVREKERLEASLNLFDEKSKHRQEFIQEKQNAIEELELRNKKEEKELKKLKVNYAKQKETLDKINQKMQQLNDRRSYLEGDKSVQMEELRSQYIDYLQKQTSLTNERSYLEQEINRNELEENKLEQKVLELEKKVKENEKKLTDKQLTYQKIKEDLTRLLKQHKKREEQLVESKKYFASFSQELSGKSNELERAKAKAISLKEMQENYSGYYAGVRSVMKEKERLSGIVGTVAESIQIPEKYLLAINTVLGSSGQFIIVENEKDARTAIHYLKNNKAGRATFLPLTTIRPRQIPKHRIKQIEKMTGYLGIANDLVNNNEKVQTIIDNLLGQTILAETLEEANAIARSIQFSNRVVSLEGDVINAGGSMTGGGQRNTLNPIFSQKSELSRLKKFIRENEDVLTDLVEKQRKAEEDSKALIEEVEAIRLAGEEKRLAEQQMSSELVNLEQEFRRFSRELKVTSFELEEKQELAEEYKERLKKSDKSFDKIQSFVSNAKEDMQLLTSEQKNIDLERQRVTNQIEEISEERNQTREELAREKTKVEHYSVQIADNKKQIKKLKADIKLFDEGLEIGSKEEIKSLFKDCHQKEKTLETDQLTTRNKIKQINEENENLILKINQLNGQVKYLNDQKGKLAIKLSKNDVRMDYLFEYLVEEYKVSFEEARLLEKPEINPAEAKKQVNLLKKGIDELGPVNINAIEEFNIVNERYQFLSEQQNDLLEAKEILFNTMDDMDLIVEKQFKETFDQVKEEFSKVFPKMFGGGHAELILDQPDDLLETGIEITAQPPGKKLTQLSLLSGGERALTAISLLFAIIQVNPIPFVILDEAEAALDDANVVRFGKYLQNFEDKTQFIVITHRKGTMEHSDQLYGITMQEKGISKVVGVSLKEAEKIDGVS